MIEEVLTILDEFDAGVVGEEGNGVLRVAFSRTCEMVDLLNQRVQETGHDLAFSENMPGNVLYLDVIKATTGRSIPQPLFANFTWLANKMGMYTFSKREMRGVTLTQLFLQLRPNFEPRILEDDPGTDNVYLHVLELKRTLEPRKVVNIPLWIYVLPLLLIGLEVFHNWDRLLWLI